MRNQKDPFKYKSTLFITNSLFLTVLLYTIKYILLTINKMKDLEDLEIYISPVVINGN